MSTNEALKGLGCPRCGGMVPVPEGQAIVTCPFCEMRSIVRGEEGIRRYQVPLRVERAQAEQAFRKFIGGNLAIARSVKREARLTEVLVVHLPFWATWGRVLAWFFGQKRVGSDKNRRYEPREVRVLEEMSWNGAACDVGEFGVTDINLEGRPLEPFESEALHRSGMVFEPTGSAVDALEQSRVYFENRTNSKANLDRVNQSYVRIIRPRQGLVFYPLWVLRYVYRGRAFQVVVDGFSGEVLYGKAAGNVYYRAAVLVGGMALGAFTAIDLAGWAAFATNNSDDNGFAIAAFLFIAGLVVMFFAFRAYRYGEHYEYRKKFIRQGGFLGGMMPTSAKNLLDVARQIERMQ